jgi:ribonuclease G
MPALVGKVKLYDKDFPIFEEYGVQAELDKALRSKVWLKSGGSIVINQTEALVAVDVNTGRYVGKKTAGLQGGSRTRSSKQTSRP